MKKIVGIILIIISIVFFKGCSLAGDTKVKGVVTDIRKVVTGKHHATMDLPIVRFTYHGAMYDTRNDVGVTFFSDFKVGDSVYAYFPLHQPTAAEVYTFAGYWFSFPTVILSI